MTIPSQIVAGDTFSATESWPDYPASQGWVGKLRLVPRDSGAPIELVASASGDAFAFSAGATTTAGWAAGQYSALAWVEKAGEVHTVGSTVQLVVAPNPRALSGALDTRSQARKTLDDLLAARAAWSVSQGRVRRYTIADRQREFATPAELDAEIAFWQARVNQEEASAREAAGKPRQNRVLVTFTRPR